MKKRGELTTTHLVMIILLVLAFSVLLFLYYQLVGPQIVDKQACKFSMTQRATLSALTSGAGEELVPLTCRTEKVCVGSKLFGTECKEFENLDEGIGTARVSNTEEVEKLISQKIVECWDMMGEGRVSLFTQFWTNQYGIGSVYPICVICTRIAFDEDSLSDNVHLEDVDLYKYMLTHYIPGEQKTYYQYLTGESPSGITVANNLNINQISDENKDGVAEIGDSKDFSVSSEAEEKAEASDELAIIFMQISAPGQGEVVMNTVHSAIGLTAGGTLFLGPKFITGAVAKAANWWTLAVLAVAGVFQQGNVAVNRAVTATYCGDVEGADARSGCSAVRTVNYDKESISKYCTVIESLS